MHNRTLRRTITHVMTMSAEVEMCWLVYQGLIEEFPSVNAADACAFMAGWIEYRVCLNRAEAVALAGAAA